MNHKGHETISKKTRMEIEIGRGIQNRNIVERPVKPKHPEPASAQQSESFHCLPKDGEYSASSTSVNKLGVRHQAETFAETATLK